VLKAGQERERAKNEAQAYANDVIPRAVGSAARLKEEADAYKSRIVAQAQGDAQRFKSVLAEYQRRPRSRATACTWTPCSRSTAA
jgi:membrane protease subunit HflK